MGIDGEKHGGKINWHDSYDILIREKKSYIESRLSQGDMFYQLFLGDCCLGKQCYDHCKYKYNHSSADIRIGDLWGKTYNDDEDGVSGAVAFTQKGNEILKQCNCELVEHSFDVVAEGQMKTCPQRIGAYNTILETLKNDSKNIQDACHILTAYRKQQRQIERIKHPVRSFKNIIKKIVK